MIYDFAPINMKITKQQRNLSRFLINVRKCLVNWLLVVRNHWRGVCDLWSSEQKSIVGQGVSHHKPNQMTPLI